jgi:hypothetical protein
VSRGYQSRRTYETLGCDQQTMGNDGEGSANRVHLLHFILRDADAERLISPMGSLAIGRFGFPYNTDTLTLMPRPLMGLRIEARPGYREQISTLWAQRGNGVVKRLTESEVRRAMAEPTFDPDFPLVGDFFVAEKQPLPPIPLVDDPLTRVSQIGIAEYFLDGKPVLFAWFVDEKTLVFQRLGHFVQISLHALPDHQSFDIVLSWSPFHTEIFVGWFDAQGRYVAKEVRLEFDATLPTREQLEAAGAVHAQDFPSRESFADEVITALGQIAQILKTAPPSAFWNQIRTRKSDVARRLPKSEPQSGDTLRMFLQYESEKRGWKVNREDQSRSGAVDFGIVGIVRRALVEVKIELKNAHSDDLDGGLTTQLPAYLLEHRCHGIYWVLWFKGGAWPRPARFTKETLRTHLDGIRPDIVRAVAILDVSHGDSASRRARKRKKPAGRNKHSKRRRA